MATDIKESVREKYGEAARKVSGGSAKASCCEPTCCGADATGTDPITANLYEAGETALVPEKAILASLGCGNPTALAELEEGETVLDLGSGGGIDVLLSARRVGPSGKAYGLDMTDEMLELARKNQKESGLGNVEFLKGEIESIPLPDSSVDVIISNCVINLSADKKKVINEAFRVLRPGGRFAVSDVIRTREVPEPVRKNVELWAGCVAGALLDREYLDLLGEAGFEGASIETTRVYKLDDARAWLAEAGIKAEEIPADADGAWISGFVRATKP